jgi:hypothetical protein
MLPKIIFSLELGTSCSELGTSCSELGTSCSELGTSCLELGTSCSELGTSCSELGTSCSELGTSCSELGTSCSELGTSCLELGTSCLKLGSRSFLGRSTDADFRNRHSTQLLPSIPHQQLSKNCISSASRVIPRCSKPSIALMANLCTSSGLPHFFSQ